MPQRAWVAPLNGLWSVKSDARQVITAYETQAEARGVARSLLAATGGGVLIVRDSQGNVVDQEIVPHEG